MNKEYKIQPYNKVRNIGDYAMTCAIFCVPALMVSSLLNENDWPIVLSIVLALSIIVFLFQYVFFSLKIRDIHNNGGLTVYFNDFLYPIAWRYGIRQNEQQKPWYKFTVTAKYSKMAMSAYPFEIYMRYDGFCFSWNREKSWIFKYGYRPTHYDGEDIFKQIMLFQSLTEYNEPNEYCKIDIVKDRLYSHDYENLIYRFFSSIAFYEEWCGYRCSPNLRLDIGILEQFIQDNYNLSSDETSKLIATFEEHGLIFVWGHTNKVSMGQTLKEFWAIISTTDNNFNRWCWANKTPKLSESELIKQYERLV